MTTYSQPIGPRRPPPEVIWPSVAAGAVRRRPGRTSRPRFPARRTTGADGGGPPAYRGAGRGSSTETSFIAENNYSYSVKILRVEQSFHVNDSAGVTPLASASAGLVQVGGAVEVKDGAARPRRL